jgi:pteridine reductase
MKRIRNAREPSALAGKTVLVTGGARRVGAAICRRLHRAGANVVIHYRTSGAAALRLQRGLEAERRRSAACVQADLLRFDGLDSFLQAVRHRFGRLDVMVNNASSFYATPLGKITPRAWDDLIGTNLKAPLFLAQAASPELARRRGCIVNIVDIHAERPLEGHVVYSVAKAGLVALTRALARELGPRVRVNGVAPGAIAWPDAGLLAQPEIQREILRRTPLARIGRPDDIAAAVEFLLADAPYITGQVIAVDGGRSVVI